MLLLFLYVINSNINYIFYYRQIREFNEKFEDISNDEISMEDGTTCEYCGETLCSFEAHKMS